jgi:hypothetical protein
LNVYRFLTVIFINICLILTVIFLKIYLILIIIFFKKMSYAFNKNKKEERETKDFNSFLFFGKRTMHIPLVTTIHSLKFFHQTEDATRV